MKPVAVAKRYARALADYVERKPGAPGGTDPARLEPVASELSLVARILGSDPAFGRFFDDPSVAPENKDKVIETLARRAKAGDAVRSFLRVLVANRRVGLIEPIRRAFEQIRDDRLGIVTAETTTAVPLSEKDLKRLREALEKMTGRAVRLTHRIDPAVLGGARTRIGSKVYDGTLRRQIELLRGRLAGAR